MAKATRHETKGRSYGLHLILDRYGADSKRLTDVGLLYKTLDRLPEQIGMTKVGFPHIIQFSKKPIAGISGFIFIVESHISVHTYSEQKFISVDVYSCKEFESNTAIQFLKKVYGIKKIETQVLLRGKSFRR